MFDRFTERAIKVIMLAQEESRRLGHNFVGTEQLLLGLIGENTGVAARALKLVGFTLKDGRLEVEKIIGRGSGFVSVQIPFTPRAKKVLEFALEEARLLRNGYIGTEHLLLALLREDSGVGARVLHSLDIDFERTRNEVNRMLGEKPPGAVDINADDYDPKDNPLLLEYGTDLTKKAKNETLDPVIGRTQEIERVIQILGRRRKNNAALIGEPGVGKTAVAEGLAQKIVDNDVPEELFSKRIISIDLSLLVAGTKYRGEFEERLKRILQEIRKSKEIIVLIDEVHTLVGAGAAEGAIDAANILKPALARGEMQLIGATTITEYRKHIERDAALERRFQPVLVGEPSVAESIGILMGLKQRYEDYHKLKISDEGISAAANLSNIYIADRFLPDKAIDLIDEACARLKFKAAKVPKEAKPLENQLRELQKTKELAIRAQDYDKAGKLLPLELELKAQINSVILASQDKSSSSRDAIRRAQNLLAVGEAEIAEVIAAWTGIPLTKLTQSETEKLLSLESTLHERVIGQSEGVNRVSKAIRRARVGLKNPNRPIASFLFAGPTGVGKTELTKAIACYFFGSDDSMVRFDMSEFMEKHTVSKLIGSPPGYIGYQEGGQLTEAVRKRPYTVILFDEVEKAHLDIFNVLLQVLEDGILTDGTGRTVDFKNTLIIMTSNIGAKAIVEAKVSGNDEQKYAKIQELVNDELKQFFRPEFLNRLDDIIVFRQLIKSEISQIANIMVNDVIKRSVTQDIYLTISSAFKRRLVREGFDPIYGARPLRRAVTRLLEDEMAEAILNKTVKPGDYVVADADDKKVYIVVQRSSAPNKESTKDNVPTLS